MLVRALTFIFLLIFLVSCSKDKPLYVPSEKVNPYNLYKEGLAAFNNNDYFFANKKFSEAELNFEEVELAAKSAIMSSFSLYGINFYIEAEENLKRFLKKYPSDKNIIYANYLLAIISFEQITDEKKDLKPLLDAQDRINLFLSKYPNTEYAIDLKFKKDLITNQLAAKEMFVAKHYISTKKWIPAINRLKIIVEKFDKTVFIEEALHRLVEINYHIGLEEEAKKYASILGYNYNSSEWFQKSYKVINKDYKIKEDLFISKKKTEPKKNLLKKIIDKLK